MNILKLPDEYDIKIYNKNRIIEKYSVCPFCGENQPFSHCVNMRLNNCGILSGITYDIYKRVKTKGFLKYLFSKKKPHKVMIFQCVTCGAAWESEPYEV